MIFSLIINGVSASFSSMDAGIRRAASAALFICETFRKAGRGDLSECMDELVWYGVCLVLYKVSCYTCIKLYIELVQFIFYNGYIVTELLEKCGM